MDFQPAQERPELAIFLTIFLGFWLGNCVSVSLRWAQ